MSDQPLQSLYLVLNPSAESFLGQRKWPRILELLNDSGTDYDWGFTEQPGDGILLARNAAQKGFDAIIAVGGDGTINEVINGVVMAREEDSQCHVRFGVIYTGTSPDFCTFHNLSLNAEKAVPAILRGGTFRADLCRITHRLCPDDPPVSRYFACSANFGMGAAIARGSNSGLRKRFGDRFGTFISLLKAVREYEPQTFNLIIDGHAKCLPRTHNIFIGKNPHIASGIRLKLDIKPDDERMFLLALSGMSKFRLLSVIPGIYTGNLSAHFKPVYCSRIAIACDGDSTETEYDGDPRGHLPAEIEVVKGILPLLGRQD